MAFVSYKLNNGKDVKQSTQYQLSLKEKYHLTHEFPVIVVDNGSTNIRAGLCGEEEPGIVFPCIPGAAYGASDVLLDHQSSVMKQGVIQDWDAMEELWKNAFHKLGVANEGDQWKLECGMMMCGGFSPQSTFNSQKILEVMFEKFDVPYMCLQYREILALYATDRTTGVVLRSGGSSTTVMPVYKGFPITNAHTVSPRGGGLVTKSLMRQTGLTDYIACHKAKEKYLQILENPDLVNSRRKYAFETSDGSSYTLEGEEYTSTECLFQIIDPDECQESEKTLLQNLLFNSIKSCSIDIRKELYSNIIVCGGNSMLRGFAQRLKKEMLSLAPPKAKLDVIVSPEQKHLSWTGGSIISDMSTFKEDYCISKSTYNEEGKKAITRLLGEAQF